MPWVINLSVVCQSELSFDGEIFAFDAFTFLKQLDSRFDRHHLRRSNMVKLNYSLLVGHELQGAAGFEIGGAFFL